MLGLVDTAIMGHVGTATFIGAIAVGATMFNMLYWLFAFLRMGTGGLTAQAYGARDMGASATVLARSLLIALVISLILIALQAPLAEAILRFLDAGADVDIEARRYFDICIWGAPAALATYVMNGWFLGMQDTRTPMWITIAVNIINICLSVTFVFGMGMHIEGVALGTVLAQWIGAIASIVVAFVRYHLPLASARALADLQALRRLFAINAHIFLRTLCLVCVTVWFTRAGAAQGVITLSVNAIMMQMFMFFSYFSDGFAYAGEAIAGKVVGEGNFVGSLRHLERVLMRFGAVLAVAFAVAYGLGGHLIVGMLTDVAEVVDASAAYLPWAAAVPLCGIVAFIYDGIFIGITRTLDMLISMLVAAIVFFGLYFLIFPILGNHGLWLAFVTYLAVRGVILWLVFKRQVLTIH